MFIGTSKKKEKANFFFHLDYPPADRKNWLPAQRQPCTTKVL